MRTHRSGRRGAAREPAGAGRTPAALDPSLLSDARVGAASMDATRAALARKVQTAGGNRATGQVLARNGGTKTAEPPKKPAILTGEQVDQLLLDHPFFKPYVEPKMKKGIKAAGNVHIHDAEAFKKAVVKYLKGKDSPKNPGTEITEEEALKMEPSIRGFQDEFDQIHAHETRGDSGTIIHEAMHLFSDRKWIQAAGFHLNEGVTEYFARKLASKNSIPRAGYPQQHRVVVKLLTLTDEKTLANAYFKNEIGPLKDRVDKKRGFFQRVFNSGPAERIGTWEKFVKLMEAGKFEDAEKLL